MKSDITEALNYLPQHRKHSGKRAEKMNLDQILDERRLMAKVRSGTYDLIMMGYRYRPFALRFIKKFLSQKTLKPSELEDLFVVGFAMLLCRDNTPGPVIANELVETAKVKWGKFAVGISNAFFRSVLRNKESILDQLSEQPELALSDELLVRWKNEAFLLKKMGTTVLQRPEGGISGFDQEMRLEKKSLEEWNKSEAFQSMDPGSWELCQWIQGKIETSAEPSGTEDDQQVKNSFYFLDSCAAPGGKFIATTLNLSKNYNVKSLGTESKFPRLQILNQNIEAWKPQKILSAVTMKSQLKQWGEASSGTWEPQIFPPNGQPWDLILVDLPCSGTGTLHTRPDILSKNFGLEIASLQKIQEQILKDVLAQKTKRLCVSVCSVDPQEISFISKILKCEPEFNSLSNFPPNSLPNSVPNSVGEDTNRDVMSYAKEGLVAWWK